MRKKIGLVLSGGGAKGYAHIGLLKILDEFNIKPDFVAGTSMGAIIGAAYCSGMSGKEIEERIDEFNIMKLLDITISKNGLIRGDKLLQFFEQFYNNKKFEDLRFPLVVNAVDLITGQEIAFSKGDLSLAVRASMSIPGIFQPTQIKDMILVDGGVKNNIPVSLIKENCDVIITSNVNYIEDFKSVNIRANYLKKDTKELPSLPKVLIKTLTIMQSNPNLLKYAEQNSDVFLCPKELTKYSISDFNKSKEIMLIGELEANKFKYRIRDLCK